MTKPVRGEYVGTQRFPASKHAAACHIKESRGLCVAANTIREALPGAHHLDVTAARIKYSLGEWNYYGTPADACAVKIIDADKRRPAAFGVTLFNVVRKPRLSRPGRAGKVYKRTGKHRNSPTRLIRVRGMLQLANGGTI